MKNHKYAMPAPDPNFKEERATEKEKAQEWWGNPDVNPYTGRDYEDDDDDN